MKDQAAASKDPLSDKAIAGRLRTIRDFLRLKRSEFSAQVGITVNQLCNYELGRSPLPCGVALRVCRQFFFSEKWLATEVPPYRPCCDLMSEPVFLTLDYSEALSAIWQTLNMDFERLRGLTQTQLLRRLAAGARGDIGRLKNFETCLIYAIASEAQRGGQHDELMQVLGEVGAMIAAGGVWPAEDFPSFRVTEGPGKSARPGQPESNRKAKPGQPGQS